MKKVFPILCVLAVGTLLLLHPAEASAAVREGLSLCVQTVVPTLFPFFVVVSLLLQLGFAGWLRGLCGPFMGPLFGLRGVCALPLLAGLLGGYPAGAKTAWELYDQGLVTRQEAELLLGFCNNCGPAFLLGYVGAVLKNPRAGLWLYLIHVLSALLTGMVLCRFCRDRGPGLLPVNAPGQAVGLLRALPAAVTGAAVSVLNICAFVAVFRVLAALLPLPGWGLGALELVSGVSALSPGPWGFVGAAAMVGWGGLCVHCQTLSVTGDLRPRWHWAGKVLQAAISAALALAAVPFLWGA